MLNRYSESPDIVFGETGLIDPDFNPYDFDYRDIYQDVEPVFTDATDTSGVQFSALIDPTRLDSQMIITKGRYRFYISNPSTLDFVFDPIAHSVNVNGVQKRFIVEGINFDLAANQLVVTVNIIDNPLPLILIYVAIFAIIAAVGAVSINSVLTHIERVLDNPIWWPIILIAGVAVVVPLLSSKTA